MPDTADLGAARAVIVAGIEATPGLRASDDTRRRLADPEGVCPFADLGLDSLALMELCIHIECETGVAISVGDVIRCADVTALAAFVGQRTGSQTA